MFTTTECILCTPVVHTNLWLALFQIVCTAVTGKHLWRACLIKSRLGLLQPFPYYTFSVCYPLLLLEFPRSNNMFPSCLPLLFRLYVSPKKQVADPGPESPLKWCRQVLDHRSPETEMACRTLISRLDQCMLLINTFLHLTEPKYLLVCVFNHSLQTPLEEKSFRPSQTQRQFYRLRCLCCFLIYSSPPQCMCMRLCGFQSYDDAWLLTMNVYMVCVCVFRCGQKFVCDPADSIHYLSRSQLQRPMHRRTSTTKLFTPGLNDFMKSWAGLNYLPPRLRCTFFKR